MIKKITLICLIAISFNSCKKEPGVGGRATITGKVIIDEYDNTFTVYRTSYPGQDQNVFITYGDDNTVGDQTKSSFDGSFKFEFLQKGKYKIFVISKDSSQKVASVTIEVLQAVEITESKEVIALSDMHIID